MKSLYSGQDEWLSLTIEVSFTASKAGLCTETRSWGPRVPCPLPARGQFLHHIRTLRSFYVAPHAHFTYVGYAEDTGLC